MKTTLSVLFLFSSLLLTQSLALANKALVVSGNTNAPPISWEERKQLTGIGPQLVGQILDELNITHQIKTAGNWAAVQTKAEEGSIDLIVAAFKNDKREKYLVFSTPYLKEPTVIITEKGKEFPFKSWKDLVGKKGVSNLGESYGQEFDQIIATKLDVDFYGLEKAFKTINRGEADYLIIDLYTALIYAHLLRGEDSITILETPVAEESFSIAVSKKSPLASRMSEINMSLEKAIAAGTVKNLFYQNYDYWKKLITERSAYYGEDATVRAKENKTAVKERELNEKARIGELMGSRDNDLPPSAQ